MAKRKATAVRYHDLDEDPSCEHVVEEAVRRRVGRDDLVRATARTSTAIVEALGQRRRIWFKYEAAADEVRAKREATYFDVGVDYGIVATRATKLAVGRKSVNALAQRVVRELMRTGVARDEVIDGLLVAAWAIIGGRSPRKPHRSMR